MKKAIKIFVLTTTIIFLTAILLFVAAFAVKPFGDVFFSFCFGSCYECDGEAVLYQDGRKTVLPVYKAAAIPNSCIPFAIFHNTIFPYSTTWSQSRSLC